MNKKENLSQFLTEEPLDSEEFQNPIDLLTSNNPYNPIRSFFSLFFYALFY